MTLLLMIKILAYPNSIISLPFKILMKKFGLVLSLAFLLRFLLAKPRKSPATELRIASQKTCLREFSYCSELSAKFYPAKIFFKSAGE